MKFLFFCQQPKKLTSIILFMMLLISFDPALAEPLLPRTFKYLESPGQSFMTVEMDVLDLSLLKLEPQIGIRTYSDDEIYVYMGPTPLVLSFGQQKYVLQPKTKFRVNLMDRIPVRELKRAKINYISFEMQNASDPWFTVNVTIAPVGRDKNGYITVCARLNCEGKGYYEF